MTSSRKNDHAFLLVIFSASCASLSYEIALIRLFSITLWHHFAFMVISIAMLGIGASGTLLAVFPGLKKRDLIPRYSLLLAASIPLSYLLAKTIPFDPARLSWDGMQLVWIGVYYLTFSASFLCFGLVVSTAFSTLTGRTGAVYAADLIGASAGAGLMIALLYAGGPEKSVLIASCIAAAGALLLGDAWSRTASASLIALNVFLVFSNAAFMQPAMSPYKPLELALKFPGAKHISVFYSPYARVDLVKSPAIRFAPGLSLTYLEPLPEQTGLVVDGGDMHAITDEEDGKNYAFLNALPSGLPYILSAQDDVLILDPKGGLEILLAKQYGARSIVSMESNPLVRKVVDEYQKKRDSDNGVKNLAGLGRIWLTSIDRAFDVIDIPVMGSLPAGSFGFAEDYRFTVEAFKTYLSALKPDGMLSMTLYLLPPARAELRVLATIIEAAKELGTTDASTHLAAIRSWDTLTMVFKRSALTQGDIARIRGFCKRLRFDAVYYPGLRREESNVYVKMPGNEYFNAFQKLVSETTRKRFFDDYLFDVKPVRDENPFFSYYLKFQNSAEIYGLLREKWQYFFEQGYLLPILFVQVLALSALLVLAPLASIPKTGTAPLPVLSYFAILGLGYLFVEIAFIQKMLLVLEHPAFAASTVMASLLIGSGLGSAASQRFHDLRRPRILLAASGSGIAYALILPLLTTVMGPLPLAGKIAAAGVLFLPAGFLMGIPLPLGISYLGDKNPRLIPWAWAVNGCFSVISPILAIMIALSTGFTVVIMCGAGLYFAGFLLIRRLVGHSYQL